MPHVGDLEKEKQPFLEDINGVNNDTHNFSENSNSDGHGHGFLKNNPSHLSIAISHHEKDCDAAASNCNSFPSSSSSSSNSKSEQNAKEARAIYVKKFLSALFYAAASFLITVVNKIVLTSYKFPSFQCLAIGQICATIIVLFTAKQLRMINYPSLGRDSFRKIFLLPIIFIGNAMTGFGGTKTLILPMFTALRRFAILMTMIAEFLILGVQPSIPVQISVYTMITGALTATTNCVFIKQKLESKEFGKYGLIFYNAFFMAIPAFAFAYVAEEFEKALNYDGWSNSMFLINFFLSCLMGFILNASLVLCTQHNSALTTTIIGCLKNISVTYLGMFIGGDYVFQWVNFIGINISVLGSLLYTYVTCRRSDN